MRGRGLFVLAAAMLLSGCGAGAARSDETTAERVSSASAEDEGAAPASDDVLGPALEAAASFAASLGPILAAEPEVRGFEACDRARDLLVRSTALRDAGTPASVEDPDAYAEEIARLPAAATVVVTQCERGPENAPAGFWISAELTFYRILLQLEPSMPAGRQPASGAEGSVEAARAVRDALAPVVEAHAEERPDALCERVGALAAAVGRLEAEAVPAGLAAGPAYAAERARLADAARAAATACGSGPEAMPADLPTTLEVTADRVWLMLRGHWPGAAAAR
jgi:hypothetical protein